MLSAATSCLLVETNSLHEYAADLAGQISDGTAHAAGGGHAASASERALARENQTLASLRDAIAILGMAQQEISLRIFYFLFFDSVSAPEKYCFHLSKRRSPCKRQTV